MNVNRALWRSCAIVAAMIAAIHVVGLAFGRESHPVSENGPAYMMPLEDPTHPIWFDPSAKRATKRCEDAWKDSGHASRMSGDVCQVKRSTGSWVPEDSVQFQERL